MNRERRLFVFIDAEGIERAVRADSLERARTDAQRFVVSQSGSAAAGAVAARSVREDGKNRTEG